MLALLFYFVCFEFSKKDTDILYINELKRIAIVCNYNDHSKEDYLYNGLVNKSIDVFVFLIKDYSFTLIGNHDSEVDLIMENYHKKSHSYYSNIFYLRRILKKIKPDAVVVSSRELFLRSYLSTFGMKCPLVSIIKNNVTKLSFLEKRIYLWSHGNIIENQEIKAILPTRAAKKSTVMSKWYIVNIDSTNDIIYYLLNLEKDIC